MLAVNPGKTPISLLQEYGTRIGKTPVYDLLKAEGQAHQPNFTFRVAVGEINCTGQGPSKKAAKHKAAEAALKMLKGGLGGPAGFSVGADGFVEVDVSTDGDRYICILCVLASPILYTPNDVRLCVIYKFFFYVFVSAPSQR